jgi:hypothetical protein
MRRLAYCRPVVVPCSKPSSFIPIITPCHGHLAITPSSRYGAAPSFTTIGTTTTTNRSGHGGRRSLSVEVSAAAREVRKHTFSIGSLDNVEDMPFNQIPTVDISGLSNNVMIMKIHIHLLPFIDFNGWLVGWCC